MQTLVKKINRKWVNRASKLLVKGEIVAIPTETVYGLAGVGTLDNAVEKIFTAKGRPTDNPLIAHVHKDFDLNSIVEVEQDYVYKLLKAFTPGPLTMVFKSKGVVCAKAVCGGDTLAVRIPSHKGCQKLLRKVNLPLVAPSANLSKHTSPVTASHVLNDLSGKIPLILDGGKCLGGIESTVLDVTGEIPRILRAGLITKEMIESVVGACQIAEHKKGDKVKSPGVKYTHYKPKCETCLYYEDQIDQVIDKYLKEESQGKKAYIMCASYLREEFSGKNLLLLGNDGEEIASNLYDKLLEAETKADILIAVGFDREDGVYMGIMNRLRKSCG